MDDRAGLRMPLYASGPTLAETHYERKPCPSPSSKREEAYELFGNQRDGVVKVAITP